MSESARILSFPNQQDSTDVACRLDALTIQHDGKHLLNEVNATFHLSGVTGVMGPNGAGKSLLLRAITGLIAPTSGSIEINAALGDAAFVFQRPVLLRRSVRSNLMHALKIASVPKRERAGKLAELLVAGNLTKLAETPARQLSGGEQQRLSIVRALASSPKFLLLDEPTASLDPAATLSIEDLLKATVSEGVKVVMVTHDRAQARRMCDDIMFLHQGRLVEHNTADTFFDAATTNEAKAFVAGELLV